MFSCREEGIRTLDTVSRIPAFQASPFNHSGTSLFILLYYSSIPFPSHFLPILVGTPSTTRTPLYLFYCITLQYLFPVYTLSPDFSRDSFNHSDTSLCILLYYSSIPCVPYTHFLPILVGTPSTTRTPLYLFYCITLQYLFPHTFSRF